MTSDDYKDVFSASANPISFIKQARALADNNDQLAKAKGKLDETRNVIEGKVRSLFAFPRKQTEEFENDPTKPPPSAKDDVEEKPIVAADNLNEQIMMERIAEGVAQRIAERIAKRNIPDPLGPISADLHDNITKAIEALKSIDDILKSRTRRP